MEVNAEKQQGSRTGYWDRETYRVASVLQALNVHVKDVQGVHGQVASV